MLFEHTTIVGIEGAMYGAQYNPLAGVEPLPPIAAEHNPPHAFLPDSGLVPDEFEPITGKYGDVEPTPRPDDDPDTVRRTIARRTYTTDGLYGSSESVITGQVQVLHPSHRRQSIREALHQEIIDDELGGDTLDDLSTGWVTSTSEQEPIQGFRRTVLWERAPILSRDRAPDTDRHEPSQEFALLIQTTPWGSLEIGTKLVPVAEERAAYELVERLADACFEQILEAPAPLHDPADYIPTRPGKFAGPVDLSVSWAEMTDIERKRVIRAAIELNNPGDGAELRDVLAVLEERYGAPSNQVRDTVQDLIEEGVIFEPPETKLKPVEER